jgi:hypothetical protein
MLAGLDINGGDTVVEFAPGLGDRQARHPAVPQLYRRRSRRRRCQITI